MPAFSAEEIAYEKRVQSLQVGRSRLRGARRVRCRGCQRWLLPSRKSSHRAGAVPSCRLGEEQRRGVQTPVPLGTWCEHESTLLSSKHCPDRSVSMICVERRNKTFFFFFPWKRWFPTNPSQSPMVSMGIRGILCLPFSDQVRLAVYFTLIHRKWFNSLQVKFLCQILGKLSIRLLLSNQSYRDIPNQCPV